MGSDWSRNRLASIDHPNKRNQGARSIEVAQNGLHDNLTKDRRAGYGINNCATQTLPFTETVQRKQERKKERIYFNQTKSRA